MSSEAIRKWRFLNFKLGYDFQFPYKWSFYTYCEIHNLKYIPASKKCELKDLCSTKYQDRPSRLLIVMIKIKTESQVVLVMSRYAVELNNFEFASYTRTEWRSRLHSHQNAFNYRNAFFYLNCLFSISPNFFHTHMSWSEMNYLKFVWNYSQ